MTPKELGERLSKYLDSNDWEYLLRLLEKDIDERETNAKAIEEMPLPTAHTRPGDLWTEDGKKNMVELQRQLAANSRRVRGNLLQALRKV